MVGVALGCATGIWEAVLTPLYLRVGDTWVRLPLATLLAIVGNIALVWFTWTVTHKVALALLPGAAWFAMMLVAAARTAEGDLIITGDNWVGLATIAFGSLAWAFAAYRLILAPRGG